MFVFFLEWGNLIFIFVRESFLTVEDIRELDGMQNQVLMVFRAPPGTKLDLSEEVLQQDDKRYRIEMQSPGGPIGVWVINEPQEPEPAPLPNPPTGSWDPPPELLVTNPVDYFTDNAAFLSDDQFSGISDYYTDDIFDESLLPQ